MLGCMLHVFIHIYIFPENTSWHPKSCELLLRVHFYRQNMANCLLLFRAVILLELSISAGNIEHLRSQGFAKSFTRCHWTPILLCSKRARGCTSGSPPGQKSSGQRAQGVSSHYDWQALPGIRISMP